MTKQFKTNINCSNCVRAVTNFLNEVPGVEKWTVDTDHPDKILTVEGTASSEAIEEAVDDAGFDIEEKELNHISS
ncbi:heavy-metal-associated domain-containing protein [Lewinella sp. LCG006]|uniref:heavy-metal-associated domain-containing protein n=1 Tax=Lewinella sp. LCG006 TaxID=3231911 RepID=UPI003460590C